MLVFIAIGAAGLVVLLVSMLFGELFDLLDGALSGTGLGAGLTLFGASGVLALANGWPAAAAYLIAAVAGVVTLAGVQLLVGRFVRSEDGAPSDPAGMTGVARTTVTRTGGEVSLDGPYEVEARLATSDVDIPSGAPIRVVAANGPRVRVEPLDPSPHRKD